MFFESVGSLTVSDGATIASSGGRVPSVLLTLSEQIGAKMGGQLRLLGGPLNGPRLISGCINANGRGGTSTIITKIGAR